jgi:hypothetical protein
LKKLQDQWNLAPNPNAMVSKMQLNEQFMEPKQDNQVVDLHVDKVSSENIPTTESNLYHYYVDINKQCKEL